MRSPIFHRGMRDCITLKTREETDRAPGSHILRSPGSDTPDPPLRGLRGTATPAARPRGGPGPTGRARRSRSTAGPRSRPAQLGLTWRRRSPVQGLAAPPAQRSPAGARPGLTWRLRGGGGAQRRPRICRAEPLRAEGPAGPGGSERGGTG